MNLLRARYHTQEGSCRPHRGEWKVEQRSFGEKGRPPWRAGAAPPFNPLGGKTAQARQVRGCPLTECAPNGFSFICEELPFTLIIIWGRIFPNLCSLKMPFSKATPYSILWKCTIHLANPLLLAGGHPLGQRASAPSTGGQWLSALLLHGSLALPALGSSFGSFSKTALSMWTPPPPRPPETSLAAGRGLGLPSTVPAWLCISSQSINPESHYTLIQTHTHSANTHSALLKDTNVYPQTHQSTQTTVNPETIQIYKQTRAQMYTHSHNTYMYMMTHGYTDIPIHPYPKSTIPRTFSILAKGDSLPLVSQARNLGSHPRLHSLTLHPNPSGHLVSRTFPKYP